MSDAESEATVYGYSSDEEQHSYNIDTKNFYRGPTGYARRELLRGAPGEARARRICTFLGPPDLTAFAASSGSMKKIAMADALWDALTARAFPTSVRRMDDQDFRRVTDLAVSYADALEGDLRYRSLSLGGIDGMALAARLRDARGLEARS